MLRKINPYFQLKSMGISAFLPLVTSSFLVLIVFINSGSLVDSMPAIEFIFPIMGCWWSIFVLHDLLAEKGGEVLFALPVRRWCYGSLNVMTFYIMYMLLMVIMLLVMSNWFSQSELVSMGLQLGAQSFFYAGLGFLAMVLTRNTGWSLIIVTSYLSIELLTFRNSISMFDIYLHNVEAIPVPELSNFLIKVVILGAILFINAQYFLSTTRRYK
ncbi:hypothetical protein K0T92_14905 [Paenibacillus oenotherae]|uniref:ABC transporter permease n=1 Tax=Paenibacillus oenotherae TaxID=1435645 RepID=A0ABS7DA45_9BACL|nr:hypothetical protein [Paenibacillus oenotherae]MBW7476033.1 hypothetical protein [Paenibacillus oenotherae]